MSSTELAKRACVKCSQEKPETEFYLDGASDNGRRPLRMLSEKQVLEIVPVGRSTLWRLERAGKFPRGVFISPNRKIWYETEVVEWQDALDQSDPRRGRGKGRRHHAPD
jgi:prophage regulatory protein